MRQTPLSNANMGNSFMPGARAINVERLLLRELSGYQEQHYRPVVSAVTKPVVQAFQHLFSNSNTSMSPESLAHISANIISPTAQTTGNVAIANGWGSKRFQFILEISQDTGMGSTLHTILTGFTDKLDVINTARGPRVAPDTRLYFNNTIEYNRITSSHSGMILPVRLQHASQIILNQNPFAQHGFNQNNTNVTLRPCDVICHMQHRALGVDLNSDGIIDGRTGFQSNNGIKLPGSSTVKLSNRRNSNPADYLSRIITGVQLAKKKHETYGGDTTLLYDHARQAVAEEKIVMKPIFQLFSKNTDFERGKSVTIHDLELMSGGIDTRTHINLKDPNARFGGPSFQNTEGFGGARQVDVIAARLQHSVPSLLMDCGIAFISLEANNYTVNTSDFNVMLNPDPVKMPKAFSPGMPINNYLAIFIERLKSEVLRDIVGGMFIELAVRVDADINAECLIEISWNREPFIPWIAPVCTDNLNSQMLSGNADNLDRIATDLDCLISSVCLDTSHMAQGDIYAP